MLKDLFINMAILISFISIASQLSKKIKFEEGHTLNTKLIIGLLSGILGCTLMLFGVHVGYNTIIDFRHLAIIMSAIYGGALSVFISGALIAIYRASCFDVNLPSFLAVATSIITSFGCWYISKYNIKYWQKWLCSTIFVLAVSTVMLYILLGSKNNFYTILLIYWSSYCVVSPITYLYVNYSLSTNKQFRKLQKESSKDFLTGLNNVRKFDTIFNSAMENVVETKGNLSLLMLDIDYFKKVNDTYGHIEGDFVLKEIGKILSDNCKPFYEVSRNGGEEFSIILPDCNNSQALHIAEKIRSQVASHHFISSKGKTIKITVSIGVASYPETTKIIENLIEHADKALYSAKQTGRNKVCV